MVQENKDDAVNAVAVGAPVEKARKKKAGHSKIRKLIVLLQSKMKIVKILL